jgi:disulfide bond formation protein DsbB
MSGTAAPMSAASWRLLASAWLVALVATLSALFIGEVMGQTPCTLCWYQRIAMFPLAIILGIAALDGDLGGVRFGLPLALVGLAFARLAQLYAGLVPETIQPCTREGPSCSDAEMTLLGWLRIPFLSLGAFLAIAGLLALTLPSNRP